MLRRPQSHWALPRRPGSQGKPSLSLHGCIRKYLTWTCRGPVIPTSAASRSSVCSWECRRESPGRGRQEAWSPPGEGAAPSCSVSGTSLGAGQGPARRKCRAALQSSVRFTPGPAVQLCLISSGIASLPTLNTILPWIHDYRSSLCDAFLGVSLSTPKGRRQLGLTRLRCGVLS